MCTVGTYLNVHAKQVCIHFWQKKKKRNETFFFLTETERRIIKKEKRKEVEIAKGKRMERRKYERGT